MKLWPKSSVFSPCLLPVDNIPCSSQDRANFAAQNNCPRGAAVLHDLSSMLGVGGSVSILAGEPWQQLTRGSIACQSFASFLHHPSLVLLLIMSIILSKVSSRFFLSWHMIFNFCASHSPFQHAEWGRRWKCDGAAHGLECFTGNT